MSARFLKILLLAALALVSAGPSFAAGKLVAAVMSSDISRYKEAHRSFVRTLAQKGFDQSTTEIVVQTPNPDPISLANAIRKFEAIDADLIVTYGAPAALVAKREIRSIPVVFVDVYGPVETGVSKIASMTGTNLCGVSSKVPMITLLKTAQEFKPIRNIGVIYSSREAGSLLQLQEIKRIGVQQGFAVFDANVVSAAGLDSALNSMLSHVDYLYVSECSAGSRWFEKIVSRANAARVPVLSLVPDSAEKGALVSLEINPAEQGQLAAEYAAKVLKGVKPGQLPIVTPKKIDLIINMRVVKALDLNIPLHGLSAATRILK
ncbi:MAG TPA: ABC transporter substrate-binding protein [Geobacteraceae bacterium]|nr:ABC transporter substrate-binding protein [Geobacteraceae bacterium]